MAALARGDAGSGDAERVSPLQRLLWWLAGADSDLLSRDPKCRPDRALHSTYGAAVLGTAVFAAVGVYVAVGIAHGHPRAGVAAALFIGVLWIIFDRLLLMTFRKDPQKGESPFRVGVRFALAVLFAFLVTEGLLATYVFSDKIHAALVAKHEEQAAATERNIAARLQPRLDEANDRVNDIEDRIAAAGARADSLETIAIAERKGVSTPLTTGILGEGRQWRADSAVAAQARAEARAIAADLQQELQVARDDRARLRAQRDSAIAATTTAYAAQSGFMDRVEAMYGLILGPGGGILLFQYVLIKLFAIALDILPILLRTLQRPRYYDFARERNLRKAEVNFHLQLAFLTKWEELGKVARAQQATLLAMQRLGEVLFSVKVRSKALDILEQALEEEAAETGLRAAARTRLNRELYHRVVPRRNGRSNHRRKGAVGT